MLCSFLKLFLLVLQHYQLLSAALALARADDVPDVVEVDEKEEVPVDAVAACDDADADVRDGCAWLDVA